MPLGILQCRQILQIPVIVLDKHFSNSIPEEVLTLFALSSCILQTCWKENAVCQWVTLCQEWILVFVSNYINSFVRVCHKAQNLLNKFTSLNSKGLTKKKSNLIYEIPCTNYPKKYSDMTTQYLNLD